jgi:formylglycine-generating enzyme required for sulfatase activity
VRWRENGHRDGYAFTAPVGSFLGGASPYGALDMAGNVWEWVADWYAEDYYGESPSENPQGPATGTERTQRGGAWYDNQSWVRCTVRHQTHPTVRCDDLGFRCAVPAAK